MQKKGLRFFFLSLFTALCVMSLHVCLVFALSPVLCFHLKKNDRNFFRVLPAHLPIHHVLKLLPFPTLVMRASLLGRSRREGGYIN